MNLRQVELIQASWTAVEPIADTAAVLFYDRLFELDPALRRLFARTDMAQQRKILMQTLPSSSGASTSSTRSFPRSRRSADDTPAMAFAKSTTTASERRCSGRWIRVSATRSTMRRQMRGQRPRRRSPR